MDSLPQQPTQPPSTPQSPPPSVSSENSLPKNILKLMGIILILGSIILLLNYFGIIPLSRFFPFLPQATVQQPTIQQSKQEGITLTLPCPVSAELCQQGQRVEDQEGFIGMGFNLPVESKIFSVSDGPAVFSGTEDQTKGILNHAKINLTGSDNTYTYSIIYEYFGTHSDNIPAKEIKQGDELGTSLGGTFPANPPYNGINFLIYIISARTSDGTSYKVNNINFLQ